MKDPESFLHGLRVLITRPRGSAGKLARLIRGLGARPAWVPALQVRGLEDWSEVDDRLHRLEAYDWIVFTSGRAVGYFCRRLQRLTPDCSIRARIGAVGRATASRLASRGWKTDLVTPLFSAEGMLESLPGDLHGLKFLLPRGTLAGSRFPDGLRKRGAVVDELTIYRTLLPTSADPRVTDLFASGQLDLVTFASSSAVAGLVTLRGQDGFETLEPGDPGGEYRTGDFSNHSGAWNARRS